MNQLPSILRFLLSAVLIAKVIAPADAAYPRKTVTIICPWAAGGGTDLVSRFWADALKKEFGSPFVVVNDTGGSGAVGHSAGAFARPDGHTLTMITAELSTMHHMGISDLTYADYRCLLQVNADAAAIIVHNQAQWATLGALLDHVRNNPGSLKMSGTATGGTWDLARAGMLRAADLPVESIIWVPSQGAKPALTQLAGRHVDAVCCSVPEAAQQVEAGELRVLAVMSDQRLTDFPEIPTCRESGIDWEAVGWRGLAVPKNTPAEVVDALVAKCRKIAESGEYRAFMKNYGFGIRIRGPAEFTAFLQEQEKLWQPIVEAARYTPGQNHDPGPHALPVLLGLALVIGVVALIGWEAIRRRGRKNGDSQAEETEASLPENGIEELPGGARNVVLITGALAAYLVALPWLGFTLATLIFGVAIMTWLGVRWPIALAVSAVMIVSIRMLFVWGFQVQLPEGVLEDEINWLEKSLRVVESVTGGSTWIG